MNINSLRDKFVYDLQMMYYVENELLDVLDEMAMDASNEDIQMAFENHVEETSAQVRRLDEIFTIIDEPPEQRQSPVFDALVNEREQFKQEANPDEDLGDVYDLGAAGKTEHIEIAAYESLIMLARKLEMDDDVIDLLEQNLDEEQQTKKQVKTLATDSTARKIFTRLAG